MLVFEKESNKLVKVNTNKETTTIASNVQNVCFADNFNKVVYVQKTDDAVPYKSFVLNAVSGEKIELASHSASATAKFVGNNKAYLEEGGNVYAYDLANGKNSNLVMSSVSSYTGAYLIPNTDVIVAISKENNGTMFEYFENGNNVPSTSNYAFDSAVANAKFIGFANGSIVYHNGSGEIKTLSYANRNNGAEPQTIATVTDMSTTEFDINGSYLYFFKKVGNSEYLHRIKIDNGEATEEMIGVYLEADIPDKTEEKE